MKLTRIVASLVVLFAFSCLAHAQEAPKKSGLPAEGYPHSETDPIPGQKWNVHDKDRPEPGIITPRATGKAPSDAIVLFDGTDLKHWQSGDGSPAEWKVEDGYMEVNGTGTIKTAKSFGSCQLHVEWATSPTEVNRKGQARGNSGVMIMGKYEIQIMDSFNNRTYSDGQAAAIFGQYPPLVNAALPPAEWQSYDIIFDAPEYDGDKCTKPAYFTVLHNGVLVHHHRKSLGQVSHKLAPKNQPHPAQLPLELQDHGNPVRFRNIWIRPLKNSTELEKEDAAVAGSATRDDVVEVRFETTTGNFVVEVHKEWAPQGAAHFLELVESGFYNDVAFFRAVPDFMVQFGISGDPATNRNWAEPIKDDPVAKSNKRGYITFAKTGAPNSRTTQLFINFKDNVFLDNQGFAPFGIVQGDGMTIVDSINQEYGEPGGAIQGRMKEEGNGFLKEAMPNLDYIKSATMISGRAAAGK